MPNRKKQKAVKRRVHPEWFYREPGRLRTGGHGRDGRWSWSRAPREIPSLGCDGSARDSARVSAVLPVLAKAIAVRLW